MTQEISDRDLLDIYTRNYNAKKSEGGLRETPAQHAHLAGLRACSGLGGSGGETGEPGMIVTQKGIRVPDEDPGHAHQRRLTGSQFWLNQGDRRQRYAVRATFTDIIDAFAAGGAFERAYFEGDVPDYHQAASQLIEETANDVERKLAEHQGMAEMLDILGEMTGTDDPDSLMARIKALVEEEAAAPPLAAAEAPVENAPSPEEPAVASGE